MACRCPVALVDAVSSTIIGMHIAHAIIATFCDENYYAVNYDSARIPHDEEEKEREERDLQVLRQPILAKQVDSWFMLSLKSRIPVIHIITVQYCFAAGICWRLSSSSVTLPLPAAERVDGRPPPGAWAVRRPTLHGGPVWLRPVRATRCFLEVRMQHVQITSFTSACIIRTPTLRQLSFSAVDVPLCVNFQYCLKWWARGRGVESMMGDWLGLQGRWGEVPPRQWKLGLGSGLGNSILVHLYAIFMVNCLTVVWTG